MAITQLSVFLENKPGTVIKTVKEISKANVNIRAMCLADTRDFGILRLILSDVEKTKALLEEHTVVTLTKVIAVKMDDQAGALYDVLSALENASINIEYMYAFTGARSGSAYVVLRVDDVEGAEKVLKGKGVHSLTDEELVSVL
jgi:hypothetical protein